MDDIQESLDHYWVNFFSEIYIFNMPPSENKKGLLSVSLWMHFLRDIFIKHARCHQVKIEKKGSFLCRCVTFWSKRVSSHRAPVVSTWQHKMDDVLCQHFLRDFLKHATKWKRKEEKKLLFMSLCDILAHTGLYLLDCTRGTCENSSTSNGILYEKQFYAFFLWIFWRLYFLFLSDINVV